MKKAMYKSKTITTIKSGELFRHVDTIDKSGKHDFTGKCISLNAYEIIEPSVRQLEESAEFWTGHISNVCSEWFAVRGLEYTKEG